MPAPLLRTKLYVPRPRVGLVARPRFIRRLDAAANAKLILVSAPAGFGKTTLLAEWLAGPAPTTRSVAWVSLDRGDNDPVSFWTYLIAALQTVSPEVGETELGLLASPQPPPIQRVLTTLLNDLGLPGDDIVLVLDDYHLVQAPEIQTGLAFLLEHLPPRLHLVIAGRADPAIPLARMRARGDLVEVRAAELRFTSDEATAYLNEVMGLQLTAPDVSALAHRTEGWIAALQLAALSMQGRDDVAGFIAGFAGDDRYIVDYLAEEVLHRQPPDVRDFLLRTSPLKELNGSLCDAVTDTSGGRAMLENLDRANLFVVPLDDRRQSYRYHHLFADVLRARLADESPDLVPALHRRAGDWYEDNGRPAAAIEHVLAAGHFDRAADLMEQAMPVMRRDRQEGLMRSWLELLPAGVLADRPALSNGYAGALLGTGQFEGAQRYLRDAERWLEQHGSDPSSVQVVVADHNELRRLPAAIAIHRSGLALATGDPSGTVEHASRALNLIDQAPDLLPVDRDLGRGAASALIGLASWYGGDLDTANEAYAQALISMQRAGHMSDVLGCSIALADIQLTQGRLRSALRTYEQALQLQPEPGRPVLRGTADMYVGLSALHCERNDLDLARQYLTRSEALGEHNGLPQNRYRWRVAMAGICEAEGDLARAEELLTEAEHAYVGDFSPNVRPVPARRARLWIRQGRVADALEWARERSLSADNELSYVQEYEHITLARILLADAEQAEGELAEATGLLGRLLEAAEVGHRNGSVIEILVLQALAHRRRGDRPAAAAALERARMLGEPEGYARIFEAPEPASPDQRTAAGRPALIEPLSGRELDVLRLLATDLGGPEIARELVVSLNTVRTHTKNIYAKLGVNTRRAAVRRAGELDLLKRTPGR
jgi:LuxR family maltose regulon positive regulatory protein